MWPFRKKFIHNAFSVGDTFKFTDKVVSDWIQLHRKYNPWYEYPYADAVFEVMDIKDGHIKYCILGTEVYEVSTVSFLEGNTYKLNESEK